jgi:hypothetical protein
MSIETNITGKEEVAIARIELFTDAKTYPNEADRVLMYHFEKNVYDADGNMLASTFSGGGQVAATFGQLASRSFTVQVPNADGTTTSFTATGAQAAALLKGVGYLLLQEKQAAEAQAEADRLAAEQAAQQQTQETPAA